MEKVSGTFLCFLGRQSDDKTERISVAGLLGFRFEHLIQPAQATFRAAVVVAGAQSFDDAGVPPWRGPGNRPRAGDGGAAEGIMQRLAGRRAALCANVQQPFHRVDLYYYRFNVSGPPQILSVREFRNAAEKQCKSAGTR